MAGILDRVSDKDGARPFVASRTFASLGGFRVIFVIAISLFAVGIASIYLLLINMICYGNSFLWMAVLIVFSALWMFQANSLGVLPPVVV